MLFLIWIIYPYTRAYLSIWTRIEVRHSTVSSSPIWSLHMSRWNPVLCYVVGRKRRMLLDWFSDVLICITYGYVWRHLKDQCIEHLILSLTSVFLYIIKIYFSNWFFWWISLLFCFQEIDDVYIHALMSVHIHTWPFEWSFFFAWMIQQSKLCSS